MKKIAFVFPGQGAQKLRMLSQWKKKYPYIKNTFEEASSVLNYDMWSLIQDGPVKKLNITYYTQPVMLTTSVALYRLWKSIKPLNPRTPDLMAGHSLGEYTALVCAGVIKFQDALLLVQERGKLMQESVSKKSGMMAVINGISSKQVIEICKKISNSTQIVVPASFNSAKQTVISGDTQSVKEACNMCEAVGAKKHILSVSIPSHCRLMEPAAKKLSLFLENIKFNTPQIPVLNNVDIKCETSPASIKLALKRQMYEPVNWSKIIEYMSIRKICYVYEIGYLPLLTNLNKRISGNLISLSLNQIIG